jgi:hypothetical protein
MWQAVLIQVGQGVLQGAGSKIFDSFFGNRPPDFEAVLAEAIRALSIDFRRAVQDAFDRAEFKDAAKAIGAAQRGARQYNLSPETRKDILDEITINLSSAIVNLEALGPVGLGAYFTAVSLEVALIQERSKIYGDAELKVGACDSVPSAEVHLDNMVAALKHWNKSRFTNVFANPLFGQDGETVKFYRLSYEFEGQRYEDVMSEKDFESGILSRLDQKRLAHIEREETMLFAPFTAFREALVQLQNWSITTGVQCKPFLGTSALLLMAQPE